MARSTAQDKLGFSEVLYSHADFPGCYFLCYFALIQQRPEYLKFSLLISLLISLPEPLLKALSPHFLAVLPESCFL